jgi:Leucine-rich repeat (LRR) protein
LTYAAVANGSIVGPTPQTVNYGTDGTLVTATPALGYHFVSWSDGVLTEARTDTNVTANISVTASFAINTYTLTYAAVANGSIVGPTPQTVNYGTDGTLVTATPALGYHFSGWSDLVSTPARTDLGVTANLSVTANFAIDTFTISGTVTVGATGLSGVTMSGLPGSPVTDSSGNYTATVNYGSSFTVTPTRVYYTFDPAWIPYTNVTADMPGQDYSASLITTSERQALIALYDSTNGNSWTNNSGWKTEPLYPDGFAMPGTEGTWFGVSLEGGTQNVIQLSLYSNNLTGTLPAALGNLTYLRYLYLQYNSIGGSIPTTLGNLANLLRLNLEKNQLSGSIPSSLGNLVNLQDLTLTYNLLTGSIPIELGNMTHLEYLIAYYNDLSGSIPAALGNLANLKGLSIGYNKLTGSIPEELGNLLNLRILYLEHNQLSGSIPGALGGAINLENIRFYSNELTGPIPSGLSTLTSLQQFDVNTNQLNGTIPTWFGSLPNLKVLYIQSNQFSGSIPVELGSVTGLEALNLSSNQLEGSIPAQLGNLVNLQTLQLQGNKLTGSIPASLVNLTNINPPYLNLGYNALYTSDAALVTFLNSKDPDWASTQTIAPSNVMATSLDNAVILVSWLPITYTGDSGYYKILVSQTATGPYTDSGQTTDKTAASAEVNGLTPGETYYFVVQAHTDAHANNLNIVESENSAEVWAVAWTQINVHMAGTISAGGSPLENVLMSGLPGSPVTNSSGVYDVIVGAGWSGTVTPTLANYAFSPVSTPYTNVTTNQTTNYTATLIPPTITVTSPNGGESWAAGSTHAITWTQTGLTGSVTIDLYRAGVYQRTLGTAAASAGTFSWVISATETAGTDYRILVWQSGVSDNSDANFGLVRKAKVDFNNDGQEDILWRRYGSGGYNAVWFLGNSGMAAQPLLMANTQMTAVTSASQLDRNVISSTTPTTLREMGVRENPENRMALINTQDMMGVENSRVGRVRMISDPREAGKTAGKSGVLRLPSEYSDARQIMLALKSPASADSEAKIAAASFLGDATLPAAPDLNWQIVGTGDFNQDGQVDILWRYYGPGGYNVVWFMNGTNWTGSAVLPAAPDLNWRIMGTGDFNKDGNIDILWRNIGPSGAVVIWYMNGTTWTGSAEVYDVTDSNWQIVATGDFNLDGDVDILWRYNGAGGYNVIWYMKGASWDGSEYLPSVTDLNWQIAGAGDYDGDGSIDLLWRYYGAGGYNTIWYLTGAAWTGGDYLLPAPDLNWKIVNR